MLPGVKNYLDNSSKNTKIRERVLDVLQVHLTSPEGATALLPAWVLTAKLLGEVVWVADFILAVKIIRKFQMIKSLH